MSKSYPKKIWTKFESDQFRQRFGEPSVIPIWFKHAPPGALDETKNVGGLIFDPTSPVEDQLDSLVEILAKKLEEDRQEDMASDGNGQTDPTTVEAPAETTGKELLTPNTAAAE